VGYSQVLSSAAGHGRQRGPLNRFALRQGNIMTDSDEHRLWLALAELFFLDTEIRHSDFDYVASLLEEADWDGKKTRATLVELIAPAVGFNSGRPLRPTLGEWSGFESQYLCVRIERLRESRSEHPKFLFFISDLFYGFVLKKRGMDLLLRRMG
jgi:hypothetical protein